MSVKFLCSLSAAAVFVLLLQTSTTRASDGQLHPSPTYDSVSYGQANSVLYQPTPDGVADEVPPAAPESSAVHGTASCNCAPRCCTCSDKAALKKAVAGAHKGLFYTNDFGYLYNGCYNGCQFGDALKRNCLGDHITYDVGGQFRMRVHREENHRGLGLTGRSDDFLLYRTRLYTNIQVGSRYRFFAEYIDAVSNYEQFAPRPIEENRSDILNLFSDFVWIDNGRRKLTSRFGRQELIYGAERTVSPLDWANTRQTFDGAKLMYSGDCWDIDAFAVRPLQRDFRNFDETNDDQDFYGVYSSYKGLGSDTLELYWLALDNDAAGFYFDSFGGRYAGSYANWLVEVEGNYQFGSNADGSDHDAGAFTIGLGHNLCGPRKPTLWGYIDWASGDGSLGAGNGHHHFFPLVHKYLGLMDLFGRRNIIDANVLLTMQPAQKVKLLLWYHNFWLENDNDSPYNINMSPFAAGVTPVDDELGQELDMIITCIITPRMNIAFGYSHFWAGGYYDSPGLSVNDTDADFFWSQYQFNF